MAAVLEAPARRPAETPVEDVLLALRGVTLQYRTPGRIVTAAWRIDLEIAKRDRFMLLGPSGCGKSSLLKAVAGFLSPAEGEIAFDGRRISGPGPDRVVVFQEFDQLLPWRTVRGNVAFPLRTAHRLVRREAQERADHYLAKVGLERFADAYPHTLSGGMKQRVAIARALASEPRVLLMDEPFAALDALTRRRMQEELLRLWDELRFTLLFVTHSIDEALLVGSRIAVLSAHPGQVVAELDAARHDGADPDAPALQAARRRIHRIIFGEDQTVDA